MRVERSVSLSWGRELADPSACRPPKPRRRGLTMVLDKGMGLAQFADWLQTVGDHVDIVKLGFGTAALYPPDVLRSKIRLAAERGVQVTPGGTFFEVAFARQQVAAYLDHVARLGFTAVEISDGTVSLPRAERTRWIREALARGLVVYTEYGKKSGAPCPRPPSWKRHRPISRPGRVPSSSKAGSRVAAWAFMTPAGGFAKTCSTTC